MIAFPHRHASARRIAAPRPLSAGLIRALLVLSMTLAAPAAAQAAQGGVSVGGGNNTKAKAKGAQAEEAPATALKPRSVSKPQIKRAQTLLRTAITGSNDTKTRKVVKRFQQLRGISTHGIIDVPTYLQIKDAFALLESGGAGVDGADGDADAGGATTADAPVPVLSLPANLAPITPTERAILDAIGQCESQGDPTVVSSSGLYRGKYQFDRATWKSVGGTGDPAAATEAEQDQRAAILLRQRGTAPWPVCSQTLP
ncbi:MAG: transglycosylase family protein [Solirubrobacteraceae bacterium]|nr:transglycosylase family protein [Solirubrobacteraceae bacterium]